MRSVSLERLTGAYGAEMGHVWLPWVGRFSSDSWSAWSSGAGEGLKAVGVALGREIQQ